MQPPLQDVAELCKRLGTGLRVGPVLDLQIAVALQACGALQSLRAAHSSSNSGAGLVNASLVRLVRHDRLGLLDLLE